MQQIVMNIFDLIPVGKIIVPLCQGDLYGLCSLLVTVKVVMSLS